MSEEGDLQEWLTRVANKTPRPRRGSSAAPAPCGTPASAGETAGHFFGGGAKAQATAKNKRRRDARAAARDNPDPEAGQSVVRGAAVRKLARGQVKAVREEALAKERERKKKTHVSQQTGREQFLRMVEARFGRALARGALTAPGCSRPSNPKEPTKRAPG